MTPVVNNGNIIRLLSSESEVEEKNYLYVNSTTQRCRKKIFNNNMVKHRWCTLRLELRIQNGPTWILWGLEENLVALSL
jgi:hypothetical protein